jgi:hypothetical protein
MGFATMLPTLSPLDGRAKSTIRMKITDAGQKTIAE